MNVKEKHEAQTGVGTEQTRGDVSLKRKRSNEPNLTELPLLPDAAAQVESCRHDPKTQQEV